jgi:peptidoglycan/LPS O-acetylase OafA/YrhL
MIVLGPLIGVMLVLGVAGLLAGSLIARLILHRAKRPDRVARVASWVWGVAMIGCGMAAAAAPMQPDPLDGAVVAFFLWVFAVNAVTGGLAIRARVRRFASE